MEESSSKLTRIELKFNLLDNLKEVADPRKIVYFK